MDNQKGNSLVIILLLIIVVAVIFLFPIFNRFIEKTKLPTVERTENKEEQEVKTVTESDIANYHKPYMRNGIYSSNTYYSLDIFTIDDMSNNDKLYNAFLSITDPNVVLKSEGRKGCTLNSKSFNNKLMDLRVKNSLGKNVQYSLETFKVPEGILSDYVGEWVYNSSSNSFIYQGLCKSSTGNTRYYDLEQFIKAEYNNRDVVAYYYVGFAKVEGNNYIIYKDADMKEEISKGVINDISELKELYNKINNKNKKVYKYTFKNTLCSYSEYCLYKGEWVNEF